ncbi:unnamed protein product [Prorocentrum cordatum]|uniref:non-specific serine/threonine protein kinase n=1 Tax=Prorocentrum cordatum TaxID=2364126 RepID=A0ABN9QR90_9DINO|nr:unnamed protein product [Polarella glacialis]
MAVLQEDPTGDGGVQADLANERPARPAAEGQEAAAEKDEDDLSDESWDEYDCDDDYWDHDRLPRDSRQQPPRCGVADAATARHAVLQRLQARINFDALPQNAAGMGHAARNSAVASERKAAASKNYGLTRDTRATVDQVLDPRTLLVLSKFLKNGVFEAIHGCISTGKEANVYYAVAPGGLERAVKVYKTSILVFKDRARYVEGEYRFRHGYCKSNPRKMVAQWAEKEMRNLKRFHWDCRLVLAQVMELRQNVLVMQFIGEDGDAAPRLKDVTFLSPDEWLRLYIQCAVSMRRMMQEGKLVHGDLSEFNMLYHAGDLYIIDVSQSVECDHPHALDFLKRDCVNVNNFFSKRTGCHPVSVKRLFDFVVTKELPGAAPGPECEAEAFEALLDAAAEAMSDTVDLHVQACDRDLCRRRFGHSVVVLPSCDGDVIVDLESAAMSLEPGAPEEVSERDNVEMGDVDMPSWFKGRGEMQDMMRRLLLANVRETAELSAAVYCEYCIGVGSGLAVACPAEGRKCSERSQALRECAAAGENIDFKGRGPPHARVMMAAIEHGAKRAVAAGPRRNEGQKVKEAFGDVL